MLTSDWEGLKNGKKEFPLAISPAASLVHIVLCWFLGFPCCCPTLWAHSCLSTIASVSPFRSTGIFLWILAIIHRWLVSAPMLFFLGRLQNWLTLMNTPTNCPPASHSGGASIVVYPITFFFVLILFHFEWLDSFWYSNNYTVQLSFLWFLKQYDLEYVVVSFLFFSKKMTIKIQKGTQNVLIIWPSESNHSDFYFPCYPFLYWLVLFQDYKSEKTVVLVPL